MGYACPVCGTPEVDARHLANHVAFTALTGDAAHEDWLDERVPGWGELGEDELAERVVPHAEETDVADVFDEGGGHDHDHGTAGRPEVGGHATPAADLDEETAEVLAEAREYTRRMAESDRSDDDAGDDDTGDGDPADDDSADDDSVENGENDADAPDETE